MSTRDAAQVRVDGEKVALHDGALGVRLLVRVRVLRLDGAERDQSARQLLLALHGYTNRASGRATRAPCRRAMCSMNTVNMNTSRAPDPIEYTS